MQLQNIMCPNTDVEVYIYMCVYSFGVGLYFGLGLLHCKPKPLHDNQPMFGVSILETHSIQSNTNHGWYYMFI